MSAWVVSKQHIDLLVSALRTFEIAPTGKSVDEIGRELWGENVSSVNYRYGAEDETPPYTFTMPDLTTVTVIYKQARCYDYQSCEHPQWEASTAYRWINLLIRKLDPMVDDSSDAYSLAPWGI